MLPFALFKRANNSKVLRAKSEREEGRANSKGQRAKSKRAKSERTKEQRVKEQKSKYPILPPSECGGKKLLFPYLPEE